MLQLKWFHQFQFAGYYAAKEKGFYAEEDLDVEILERDPKKSPIDNVLLGQADFGISDASLILHRMRGSNVVALAAIFQHSPLVLLTRAEDNILGPQGLQGKRVMRQQSIDDAAVTALFHQEGIGADDVINIPQNFRDGALLDGSADAISAYLTNQPYFYKQKNVPIRIINPLNYGIDFYGDMLFTSEKMMRERPDFVLRFRRASLRGWKYALEHPDEVNLWLTNWYGSKKSPDHLAYEADMTAKMIQPDLFEIGHLNTLRFSRIADVYRELQMVPADAALTNVDYREYLVDQPAIPVWVLWILGVTALLALISISLFVVAKNLQRRVMERTAELRDARDTLQRQVDIIDRHVIMSRADANGIITYASEAFSRVSKYSKEEIVGQTHAIFSHPDTPQEFYDSLRAASLAGKRWSGEIKSMAKDGSAYWVDVTVEPDFDSSGNFIGYTSLRYDITDKKRIEVLSETDRLTGLPNRLKLDETFEHEIERAIRYPHPLSIIIFDVDHFKQVNDTHGHQVGDDVLVALAKLARAHIRNIDVLGRWGGEEFLIICPETDQAGALVLAENLREAIAAHDFPVVGHKTASFGVTEMQGRDDEDDMVRRADDALYRAKEGGRNRVEQLDSVQT